jgi:hypothetical protein
MHRREIERSRAEMTDYAAVGSMTSDDNNCKKGKKDPKMERVIISGCVLTAAFDAMPAEKERERERERELLRP